MEGKFWLISEEDIDKIRLALRSSSHTANDVNCEDWPPEEGCRGCDGQTQRDDAVHTLDTGLHKSDEQPKG